MNLFSKLIYNPGKLQIAIRLIHGNSIKLLRNNRLLPAPISRQNHIDSVWRRFRRPDANKIKQQDLIPEEFNLIYRNTMYRYFFSAQIISSALLVLCVIIVPFLYSQNDSVTKDLSQRIIEDRSQPVKDEVFAFVAVLATLCVLLQVMLLKVPMRIYNYGPTNEYVFVFYGNMPFSKTRVPCTVKDVSHVAESGILPWRDSVYEIKNKRNVILLENYFNRPADLNILLGYQKSDHDVE